MSDQAAYPCCEHCGEPTVGSDSGTAYGSGLGHDRPCSECQQIQPFRPERGAE